MQQIAVLFVCLGNICRSPMAEFIFKDKVKKAGLSKYFSISSAGTSGWHNGETMHCGTAELLERHQIESNGFRSRQVSKEDIQKYHYLIAMDESNLKDLEQLFGQHQKIFKITTLCQDLPKDHIPDPWYTKDFDETYRLLDRCCDQLLLKICRDFKL
ncbi:protein-tyrosine-phosphatase [Mergibacter septicus]|uniref:protein-tyrosine-phosphatase n=1 Tax=Mergibacter septicus TaxID=221402 RepID=A0A8E3MHG0_9PAST|nr:low molecular weight protein-tyrosine-phosphatase [Mergibacter septicus]AWX16039.1 protein-tyrosine-phosphatase [Mergibacter septicus]QDJ15292.1 protein-tyrosine-phosphatase [Mergibacter septicus]UTU48839.1 low molecular weight phosphotyrosine protein phosphatase [Mergibacter septicus]WMR95532.1 low molecular weight protein-tyrosine-phosphatase [Mergibacter septicus]